MLWAKRAHVRRQIASTTKIMTALVAMSRLGPHSIVTVDKSVTRVPPFKEGLRPGERVEAWKLFYGTLLYVGERHGARARDRCRRVPGRAFVALMNEKAQGARPDGHALPQPERAPRPRQLLDRMGHGRSCPRTRCGTRASARSSARSVKRVPWAAPTYAKIYVNHNHLLGSYPGADGVKTGWTTLAKHCLVALCARRGGVRLIAVVLGADDMYGDVKKLLDFGFAVAQLTSRQPRASKSSDRLELVAAVRAGWLTAPAGTRAPRARGGGRSPTAAGGASGRCSRRASRRRRR